MSFPFRAFAALCLGLSLLLAGCGSKEPAQRTAFIGFLQTRILDKPGLHVPKLTEEEKGRFGDYAAHYAVISDFNDGMSSAVSQPMNALIAKGAIRSIAEVVARRGDIEQVQQGMATLRAALDQQQAAADQARAALKQPDDLKTVYDQAYARTVTVPATTFKDVFPAVDFTLAETLKIADFLQKNAAKVKITGSNVTVEDPATLAELNKMLQSLQLRGAELSAAQRKLQAMVRG
ncbi:DUF3053 family protein [Variovorax sp. PAMC 28711]|uniref:DUF3053 family protein n=1 Tax=Variovorax sp. PAMC 28711 TaxID=1795631 RepID=UPI00078EA12A|nr:DUF3053 family protein [Variovorax sp. PAMC 28711]AMM25643.1 hypothetical protein AX767_15720 [Variovorax sp. PAMC 28711]